MLDSPLFAELRRRRVFRAAGIYAAAVFTGLQAVQLFQDALGLPDVLLRLLAVASIVGFPAVLALAWIFQKTPDGVVQDETFVWSPGQLVAAGGATLVTLALAGLILLRGPAPADTPGGFGIDRESNIHARRVAILPFANVTGNPGLDALGAAVADYVANALLETQLVEISDPLTVRAAVAAIEAADRPSESTRLLGEETGAAYLVSGSINPRGESVELAAQITDSRQGTVLESLEPVRAPLSDPLAAAVPLRSRLQTSLAGILEPSLADFDEAFADPPSFESYRAHLDGLGEYLDGRYTAAYGSFTRAMALDSTFVQAQKWQVLAGTFSQPEPVLDSLRGELDRRRSLLSEADRHQLEMITALQGRPDWERAYRAALARVAAAPGSDDAVRELAIAAYRTKRYEEATRHLLGLDPNRGLMRRWTDYWAEVATTYLSRGMADSALIFLEAAPDEVRSELRWQREYIATMVTLGRESELLEWGRSPASEGSEMWYSGFLYLRGLEDELAYLASRPNLDVFSAGVIAYMRGDLEAAAAVMEELAEANPRNTGYRWVLALARERQGMDTSDLEESLKRDTERGINFFSSSLNGLAHLEMVRGNRDASIAWLQQLPGGDVARLVIDPHLGDLAGSEEFEALMRPRGGS